MWQRLLDLSISISIICYKDYLHIHYGKKGNESRIRLTINDKDFKDLGLNDGFFTKLEDEKITGQSFLMLTGWKFKEYGMTLRQALELEDYIKGWVSD